jgi:hypothetical protein
MRKWLGLLLVAGLFLGACNDEGGGEPSEDAKATLVSAFEAMGEADAQSVTVSIASDPESLSTLSEGAITEDQAATVLGSSITVDATNAEDPADRAVRVVVNIEGTDGVEFVVVGSDLYLRADVQGFIETFGLDDSGLQTAIAQAEAQGLAFVRPLASGEFVKFSGATDLASGASPAPDAAQQQELLKQFGDAIEAEATVTSEGTDDVGEHLVATVPLRALYQRLISLFPQAGGGLPPGMLPPAEQIPDRNLSLDVWVADGKVAQIEFDVTQLGQFAEESGEENPFEGVNQFALRVVLSEDVDEIAAPEAATEVSAEQLQSLFGSLLFGGAGEGAVPGGGPAPGGGGGGGGGDVPGLDCSIYQDLPQEAFDQIPPETLDQLEALCPGVVPGG